MNLVIYLKNGMNITIEGALDKNQIQNAFNAKSIVVGDYIINTSEIVLMKFDKENEP